ncbi:MAG: TerB family tellurite resistance protein [Pseudomonadota bacterium]
MESDERRVAFIKALLAAAWADGELDGAEIRTIAEYLQRFEITPDEYQELKPLLDQKLDAKQALALLEEQLKFLSTPEEQNTLFAAIRDLLIGENELHPDAGEFLDGLRGMISQTSSAQLFVSRLRALWSVSPVSQRGRRLRNPSAATFFQKRFLEFYRGRIAISRAQAGETLEETVSDRDLYRTVIWAGLLGRVAEADNDFCPEEKDQLLDLLTGSSDIPKSDLEIVVNTYSDSGLANLDLSVLVKEFSRLATEDDYGKLLEGLFFVAAADKKLLKEELNVIREIALRAGFSERIFNIAYARCERRLKIGWN